VGSVQRELKASQRDIDNQFTTIVSQLTLQAEATFGCQTWAEASWPGFADRLTAHINALAGLRDRLGSGAAPQWKVDQDAAYESSALGQLMKRKERDNNDANMENR
jgi:hypothetical protein